MAKNKKQLIQAIKQRLKTLGHVTLGDLQRIDNIAHANVGQHTWVLLEGFHDKGAEAVTYIHDREENRETIPYEDISRDNLQQILRWLNEYKPEVTIHVPRIKGCNDCMFYYGKHIATVEFKGRTFYVESCGMMKAAFSEIGNAYQNEELAAQFVARRFNDKKLSKLGDLIMNNNWFRIVEDMDNSPTKALWENQGGVKEIVDVVYGYDEAIQLAIEEIAK